MSEVVKWRLFAEIIGQNLEADLDTCVNVNNPYEGCAPLKYKEHKKE